MANIEVKNLTVAFEITNSKGYVKALDDLSVTFKNGDISVILGESGSGKSTLLNAILGNVLINGDIFINGVNTRKKDINYFNVSFVSQEFALYPHLTAFDNIAFPLKLKQANDNEIKSRVERIATLFEIQDVLSRLPKELSIGQKQRVALARAFIKRSDIYLFDEPFSNLDAKITNEIRVILKKAIKLYGATAIFVSHDPKDAYVLADRTFVLNEGKMIFEGTSKEILLSNDERVKDLFKEIK